MSERVLVCGGREWDDLPKIRGELYAVTRRDPDVTVCHGECRGADRLGGIAAEQLGLPARAYPADWNRHGKAAGPIRNAAMLKQFRPTMVLAFHDNIAASKGTADMVRRSRKAGIPTFVYAHQQREVPPDA